MPKTKPVIKTKNPHPANIRDEVTGIRLSNQRYTDWEEGYLACQNDYGERVESLTGQFKEELRKLKRPEKPGVN